MKVLNISLDNKIFDEGSALRARVLDYADLVDKYTVVVPLAGAGENKEITVSDKLSVIGVASKNKITALFDVYNYLDKLILQEKPDVITVQDQYYMAAVCLKLAKKYKIGLEIQNHGFEKFCGFRRIIFKYVIKRANAVRTVSQRLKKRLIEEFGVKEEGITVVPIYVETKIPGSQIPAHRSQKNNFIFLTVGRLVPVKNIEMQIQAMVKVSAECPDAELWIVGDGSLRLNYRSQITDHKLGERIKLLGWQKNVDDYYRQADVFLLTSHAEAWPLVIIEAASYGLPIITTDTGSAGEFIFNNENGIVIPVNCETALEEAMIKLCKDEALREKLSFNVLKSLEELPSKEKILNKYLMSWQKANNRY